MNNYKSCVSFLPIVIGKLSESAPQWLASSETLAPADPPCGLPDEPADGDEARDALIEDIVNDSLNFQNNEDENRYKSQSYAYTEMKQNDSLISNTAREQFMTQTEQENIGLFDAVNDSLEAGNVSDAEVINNIIIDTNLIESNNRSVNDIVISSQQSIVTSGDTSTLTNIAVQDPVYGGNAVYIARALLRLRIIDKSNSQLRLQNSIASSGADNDIAVYPVPASGYLFVSASGSAYLTALKLFDVTGRLLMFQKIENHSILYKLQVKDIGPGSYTLEITDSAKKITLKKVVLIH